MPTTKATRKGKRGASKPASYHWHVYTRDGEKITTCEYKGGRDKVKRVRREQSQWPSFGFFSRIIAGEYQP